MAQPNVMLIKYFPLIVVWGVWLAQKRTLYDDLLILAQVTTTNNLAILEGFKQIKTGPKIQ